MIWWHRVGQKVVCKVDASWGRTVWDLLEGKVADPVKGQIYTIKDVLAENGDVGFRFEEITRDGGLHYVSTGFEPVRDTSIESLRQLLNPTPEQRRALEDA